MCAPGPCPHPSRPLANTTHRRTLLPPPAPQLAVGRNKSVHRVPVTLPSRPLHSRPPTHSRTQTTVMACRHDTGRVICYRAGHSAVFATGRVILLFELPGGSFCYRAGHFATGRADCLDYRPIAAARIASRDSICPGAFCYRARRLLPGGRIATGRAFLPPQARCGQRRAPPGALLASPLAPRQDRESVLDTRSIWGAPFAPSEGAEKASSRQSNRISARLPLAFVGLQRGGH